jgi:hypothetical protein
MVGGLFDVHRLSNDKGSSTAVYSNLVTTIIFYERVHNWYLPKWWAFPIEVPILLLDQAKNKISD